MQNFNHPATISQITKCIKNNKHNVKINLNVVSKFEQSVDFVVYREPKKVDIETSLASKSVNEDKNTLHYSFNQIINIPKKLNEGFDNKLDLNYYIFGVPKVDSFFYSILYVVSKDFKLKKDDVRSKYVAELKETMLAKLPNIFRDNQYSKYNYKRTQIADNFQDASHISEGLMCLASDYLGINLIILNYDTEKYWLGKEYDNKFDEKNVVIIFSNGIYLPVIHIYGEFPDNFIYKCIMNRFKIYRKLATNTELSVVEQETKSATNTPSSSSPLPTPTFEANSNKVISTLESVPDSVEIQNPTPTPGEPVLAKEDLTKTHLRGFSGYKLPELQELAQKFGIALNNDNVETNKSKPKTKKQLYDELSAL